MKKRIGILLLCIVMLMLALAACSSSYGRLPDNEPGESGGSSSDFVNPSTDRKIIYSAELTITGENLSDIIDKVKALTPTGSWNDSERIGSSSATIIVRVKTDKFDAFIDSLKDAGKVSNLNKTATDITSSYSVLSTRKKALEIEQTRLLELLESASISEIVSAINPRLSAIESELLEINDKLSGYDSRMEYSVVTINIYSNATKPAESFGEQVSMAFKDGWGAVVAFSKWLVKFLVTLVPLLVIFIPLGAIIFLIVLFVRKRRKNRIEEAKMELNERLKEERKDDDDISKT